MKKALLSAIALVFAGSAFAQFSSGTLIVSVFGDGTTALSSAGTNVTVVEYTKLGVLTGASAATDGTRFTNSGSATSEGALTGWSSSGVVLLGGYNAAVGTTGIAASSVARTVAKLNLATGAYSYQDLDTAYSGNNIRSAFSFDASTFFTGGTSSTAGGVRQGQFGTSTTAQIGSATPTNFRVVNGNPFDTGGGAVIYASSATGAFQGISRIDSVAGTTTLLSGFPTSSGPSPYDFFFSDASTLYVADDRSTASGGGLQKWTSSAGTWSLAYTMSTNLTAGLRSLAYDGSTIYAVTADSTGNKLVSVTDAGAGSAFTTLATAGMNQIFRGVEATPVPEPASLAALGIAALGLIRRGKKK